MKAPPPRGFLLVATRELRWMRRDRIALFLAIGVPLIAFALLAWTFSNAVIRDLKVSFVDADRSPTSMIYVQGVASAPGVSVAERLGDLSSAMHAIRSGEAIGPVYIPENFERDLMARKRPQIIVFYNRQFFTPGNSASAAISNAIAAATATPPPTTPPAGASFKPGTLVVEQYVLTNPALNYAQLGGVAYEQSGRRGRRSRAGARAIIGQALAHLILSLPGLALYLIILPRLYGFSTLGRLVDLFLIAVPFILSVSLLAQFFGAWFKRRETAVLLFIAVSLPLFFMVGVSWPIEAIPPALRAASRVVPSTSAIDALVRVNQMGATLRDVSRDWIFLWGLVGAYGALAVAASYLASREPAKHGR